MSEHTAGPWVADGSKGRGQITVRRADDPRQPIADMWLNGDDHAANAHLIAAAPELLEALTKICDFIDNEGPAAKEWEAISDWCEKGRAAIEKANG